MQKSIFKKVPTKYPKPRAAVYKERFKHYLLGLLDLNKTKEQVKEFAKHPCGRFIGEEESVLTKQAFNDFLTKMTLEERVGVVVELESAGVL